MPHAPLTSELLRRAADDLARVARGDVQIASRLIGEVLLAQAEQRSAAVSHPLIDARMASHGATDATAATASGIRPLESLRHGPRTDAERAVVSVLMARHLGDLLDAHGGLDAVRALLPGLDWLEFTGPYTPYGAARVALPSDTLARLDSLLRTAPIDASSDAAAAAIRALRGLSPAASHASASTPPGAVRSASPHAASVSVAGEIEGLVRTPLARTLGIVTGWSLVRGAVLAVGRLVFSLRRPVTVTLDGDVLRVVGHTELLGRTLRTYDVRFPLAELIELRREARYPALPVAVSLVALALGALFGARAVVEGAGVAYFPLIGLGIGLILGGLLFDLLIRALFPGLRGAGRLALRAREARAVEITNLPLEEIDRLLDAVDARFGAAPRGAPRPNDPRSSSGEAARPVGGAPEPRRPPAEPAAP